MKKLVIIGAGGFGKEVAWLIERINAEEEQWDLLGFVVDNKEVLGNIVVGYPILGDCNWLKEQENEIYAVCAVGASKSRRKIINRFEKQRFATIIDPSVKMSNSVKIGEGSIICADTILTVDIILGSQVIINLDCTVGHDAILKDFVTIYPSVNISGNTILNECVEMGTGSQIIQGLTIGEETIVGAGSTVVRELPEKCTAVGSPAKPIKFH